MLKRKAYTDGELRKGHHIGTLGNQRTAAKKHQAVPETNADTRAHLKSFFQLNGPELGLRGIHLVNPGRAIADMSGEKNKIPRLIGDSAHHRKPVFLSIQLLHFLGETGKITFGIDLETEMLAEKTRPEAEGIMKANTQPEITGSQILHRMSSGHGEHHGEQEEQKGFFRDFHGMHNQVLQPKTNTDSPFDKRLKSVVQ